MDEALKKTINAEATILLKGIMTYADVASAVNKWVVTNSMRNHLLNSLPEFADLKHTTDGNKELQQSRTGKDRCDLEYIKSLPRSTLTPFSCATDKHSI